MAYDVFIKEKKQSEIYLNKKETTCMTKLVFSNVKSEEFQLCTKNEVNSNREPI